MNSKDEILQRLRAHTRETYDMPNLDFETITYDDPVAQFIETTTTIAGAHLIEAKPSDDLNELVHKAYPNASIIASNIEGINAQLNPDTVKKAQDLDHTDVGVMRGEVACAEHGCVWIPQTMKERAMCFSAEYLVILVSKANIVSNMHQAYERINFPEVDMPDGKHSDYGFGTFISGLSKTADIEQALVYGAQAARGVTVILTD